MDSCICNRWKDRRLLGIVHLPYGFLLLLYCSSYFQGPSHEDTNKLSIKHHLDTRAWRSWHRTLRKENLLLTFNPNPVSKAPLEKTSRLKITFAREH